MARPAGGNYKNKSQDMAKKLAVLNMRIEGMSYRAIGAVLGISYGTARNWERQMLDEYQLPAVDEFRKKVIADAEAQLSRLFGMLKKPQYMVSSKGVFAVGPDGQPIEDPKYRIDIEKEIRAVRDQLIKMLGANAATQTEITVETVDSTDLAIRSLIDQQTAKNALDMQKLRDKQERSA